MLAVEPGGIRARGDAGEEKGQGVAGKAPASAQPDPVVQPLLPLPLLGVSPSGTQQQGQGQDVFCLCCLWKN